MCEQVQQQQKKEYKGFFNNYDPIFVLLGLTEQLENFPNLNEQSGAGRGRNFGKCKKQCITNYSVTISLQEEKKIKNLPFNKKKIFFAFK